MNKKQIIFTLVTLLAISGYIGYGYMTRKTYYKNGQLQSVTPYKFYKKDGVYKEYYENGQQKMEVLYKDNLKTGMQINYFKDGIRLETPYTLGKKEGVAKLYYSDSYFTSIPFKNNKLTGTIDLDGINITIAEDGTLTLGDNVNGTFTCPGKEFIDNIAVKDKQSRLFGLAKCILFEKAQLTNFGTPPLNITFNGAFQFPKFFKNSTLTVVDENNLFEKQNPIDTSALDNMSPLIKEFTTYNQHYYVQQGDVIFDKNNKNITVKGKNKNQEPLFEIDLSVNKLTSFIEKLATISNLSKEDFALKLLRETTIQKYLFLSPQGKKNFEFVGQLGLDAGLLSNGSHFDFYSANEKPVLKLTKIEKGMNIKLTYPAGDKDFFTADIKVDNPSYDELIKKIQTIPDLTLEKLQKTLYSTNPFALIPSTVAIENLNLKDYEGNTVLTIKSFVVSPLMQQATGEITVYQGNQIYATYLIQGNGSQIEMLTPDGQRQLLPNNDITATLNKEWIETQRQKIAIPFIKEAEDEIKNPNKTSMTFAYMGGVEGYNTAIANYTAHEIADLISKYSTLIEASLTAHKTTTNSTQDFIIPSFTSFNLPTNFDQDKIKIESTNVSKDGIVIKVSFLDNQTELCNITAGILKSTCENLTVTHTYMSDKLTKLYH